MRLATISLCHFVNLTLEFHSDNYLNFTVKERPKPISDVCAFGISLLSFEKLYFATIHLCAQEIFTGGVIYLVGELF